MDAVPYDGGWGDRKQFAFPHAPAVGDGVPPVEYINRVRLHHALVLLAETTLPVSDVAERSGFFSMQYFYRIFRETLGNSPLSFRNLLSPKE